MRPPVGSLTSVDHYRIESVWGKRCERKGIGRIGGNSKKIDRSRVISIKKNTKEKRTNYFIFKA